MLKHEWTQQRRQRAHARLAEGDDAPEALPSEADEESEVAAPPVEAQAREHDKDAEPGPTGRVDDAATPDQPLSEEPESPEEPAEAAVAPPPAPPPPPAREDAPEAEDTEQRPVATPEAPAEPGEAPEVPQPPQPATAGRDTDARRVTEGMEVPLQSLRDRLESVLARQAQLPLDIEARHAVSEGAEGSPRATREALVQRLLDPTLTLEDVSLLLGVCRTTVRRYTDRGVLRCYRTPGNQRRFHLSDVLDFMERQSRPR